jgi:D-alanyl-D-alanine carboxypeptidase/D-alanyl-D-alanine-endopeptidase (penicillin-binding protein 4)
MIKNLFFIFLAFFTIKVTLHSQSKPLKNQDHVVNKALKTLVNDNDLKNAGISFLAVDTKTGEVVSEHNPDLSLMPASTMKVITTATALEVLGKYYTFKTNLEYSGTIDTINRVLNGNLYIKGGADPTLGSKYYNKNGRFDFIEQWLSTIKKNKIDSITGMIIADASRYDYEIAVPKWTWEDIGNYYGTGANGLTAFDNLYNIYFQSPSLPGKLTKIARIEPEIPGLEILNEVVSSNSWEDNAYIFGAPYRYLHIIRGEIPKGRNEFHVKGAIPDPANYLAWYFNNELKLSGVKTSNKTTTIRLLELKGDTVEEKRHKLDVYTSPYLISIINITNKKSINLFAEHLFNEISYKLKGIGSNRIAIDAVTDFWNAKGMDTDGFYVRDGSGLTRFSSVTAKQMVFVLRYMKKSKNSKEFYESLAVSGKSGTMRSVGRNTIAQGKVHAKSGSIRRVRTYVGYADTKSGRELAFAMNISNYNCTDSDARRKLTQLIISLAEFNL